MATLTEIYNMLGNTDFRNRVAAAVIIATDTVRSESPATANHTERVEWAARTLRNPEQEAERFMRAVLAANAGATLAQIQAATDNAIQNNVNNAVNLFAVGDKVTAV